MIILSIETSCDETAVSVVEATGNFPDTRYTILGNALHSQVETHRAYGGVYPNLAKREHALTLVPLLESALKNAKLESIPHAELFPEQKEQLQKILARENGLADALIASLKTINNPAIDAIAVTNGPGLEPALWVGISFAKALSYLWDVPIIPVDHMEGHILASLFSEKKVATPQFPAVVLLISGGHTELVLMRDWGSYEVIGNTRDDAVGEAFDKVARMLELPYPGGPEISKRADEATTEGLTPSISLPRPMIDSKDLDFSFSGLKTAVLYMLKKQTLTPEIKKEVACEFQNAVTDVLVTKAQKALEHYDAKSLILGGGVSANTHIRASMQEMIKQHPDVTLYLPEKALTTDNAVMIALAAHSRYAAQKEDVFRSAETIVASGNQRISNVHQPLRDAGT